MLIHVPCTTCDVIIFYSRRQVCQFHVTRAGWGDLSNHTRMTSTIQSMRPEKKAKKHVTLGQKFPWESCCSTRLPFLSFNFNILKAFPQIFPTELKTTKCPAEENKWRKKRRKKRRGGKVEGSWNWHCFLGMHAQTWQKLIFCIWCEGCEVYNLFTAFLVFNS